MPLGNEWLGPAVGNGCVLGNARRVYEVEGTEGVVLEVENAIFEVEVVNEVSLGNVLVTCVWMW